MGVDRIDHLAVVHLLALPDEPIGSFRRAHDPTVDLIGPHLTLVFPVSATEGDAFREHVRGVVSRTPPFDIRLRGLEESWDHWLFLLVSEGREDVMPSTMRSTPGSCGLTCGRTVRTFPMSGSASSSRSGTPTTCSSCGRGPPDRTRLEDARRQAEALNLDFARRVDRVRIVGLDDDLSHITPLEQYLLGPS